jgi:hypothetical protein
MAVTFQSKLEHSNSRDLTQENDDLIVSRGVMREADVIVKNWEYSEFLIRRTIASINDRPDGSFHYSVQINLLTEESKKLTKLFDRIGKILLNEPTVCKIKKSTLLTMGTSLLGLVSSSAGVGTMIYNYVNQSAPTLAPVILSGGGAIIAGAQTYFWKKLKLQQEDQAKLLLLRARCDVIVQARQMSKLLAKLMRVGETIHRRDTTARDQYRFIDLMSKIRLHKDRNFPLDDVEDAVSLRSKVVAAPIEDVQRRTVAMKSNMRLKEEVIYGQSVEYQQSFRMTPTSVEYKITDEPSLHELARSRAERISSNHKDGLKIMIQSIKLPQFNEALTNSVDLNEQYYYFPNSDRPNEENFSPSFNEQPLNPSSRSDLEVDEVDIFSNEKKSLEQNELNEEQSKETSVRIEIHEDE